MLSKIWPYTPTCTQPLVYENLTHLDCKSEVPWPDDDEYLHRLASFSGCTFATVEWLIFSYPLLTISSTLIFSLFSNSFTRFLIFDARSHEILITGFPNHATYKMKFLNITT